MTVVEMPVKRKSFDVIVAYEHLRGSGVVPAEESWCTFVHHIEINGHWFWPEIAKIRVEGFVEVEISAEDYEPDEYRDKYREEIAAFREGLTPEDWLEGTTDTLLRIPATRIKWVLLERS